MGYYIVLAALIHVAFAQGPQLPPQCRGPPPGVEKPHECCKIPPIFTEEDFTECGFKKFGEGPPEPPSGLPHAPPDCTKQQCILKKYSLLTDGGEIDAEAVKAFMEKWSEANPDFKPAIDQAKERCVGKDLPGPPHVCEPNKLVFCVSSTLFMECPAWEERDGCDIMKQHIEDCKKYLVPDA